MSEILILIGTFFIGLVAGFIGAMFGAAGLITIPLLMFLGLPPQVAIATNKFGVIGLLIGAISKYWKEKRIVRGYLMPLCLIAAIGAYIGAKALLRIDPQMLSKIIAVIIFALVPFLFLKGNIGIKHRNVSKFSKILGYIICFPVAVFGGFFGGGAGTIASYNFMFSFGLPIVEANATERVVGLVATVVSLAVLMSAGAVDYFKGGFLFTGMLIGGWFGAHVATKNDAKILKTIFAILVFVLGLKLLLS